MSHSSEAGRAAERVARESYGRLVAYLAARTRDVAGAEDALADAFAAALRVWPVEGVPDNPDAWLLTAARHRQTDAIRRRQTRAAGEAHVKLIAEELEDIAASPEHIPDRRLALMFACAHPAIERGMRAPLILQTILGLTANDIAAAFLIPPATMGQRLVRAKARIKDAGIPFRIPEPAELPDRLDAVLDAIYAAYSKGWNEVGEAELPPIADEAIWLGRLIVSLLPEEPEALGLLALMLHTDARRPARRSPAGDYVPLSEQDADLWDERLIAQAEQALHAANRLPRTGRFQIEAAIQSAHAVRRLGRPVDWRAILALYDALQRVTTSPVVSLNRAMALAEVAGPVSGLTELERIATDARLENYQPFWAAKADLLKRAGSDSHATEAYAQAIALATDPAIRKFLVARSGTRH